MKQATLVKLVLAAVLSHMVGGAEKADGAPPAMVSCGTVTKDQRIPGVQHAKGDCNRLERGGYMKFDLSGYPADKRIRKAHLQFVAKESKGNPLRWVCHLPNDPTTADVRVVFEDIQAHKDLLTSHVWLRKDSAGKVVTYQLNKRAVRLINERLAGQTPEERWIAMSLTFE